MAAEKDKDKGEAGEKKSGGGLLTIILLVLVVIALGMGGFAVWKMMDMQETMVAMQTQLEETEGGAMRSNDATKPMADAPGQQIAIEPLTVNLADTDTTRYLRIEMKFEIAADKPEDVLEPYMGSVKDLLINVLSSKTSDMLRTPQGKYTLKEELKYRINEMVGGDVPLLRKIYFGEFIIQ